MYNQIINPLQERSKPRKVTCEIFFARGKNHFDVDFSALLLNRKARIALGPIGLSGRLSFVLVHNIKPVLGLQQKKAQSYQVR